MRNGDDFSCKADGGPSYFVGRRVPYHGNIGLYNVFAGSKLEKLNYQAADFQQPHGFWAAFIEPTAMCEGRNFLTLNTYDRAAFTFGFAQFAAHVENGDFVKYFRAMLGLPEAPDYFPHLGVVGGRICQTDGAVPVPLENDQTTKPLMNLSQSGSQRGAGLRSDRRRQADPLDQRVRGRARRAGERDDLTSSNHS